MRPVGWAERSEAHHVLARAGGPRVARPTLLGDPEALARPALRLALRAQGLGFLSCPPIVFPKPCRLALILFRCAFKNCVRVFGARPGPRIGYASPFAGIA